MTLKTSVTGITGALSLMIALPMTANAAPDTESVSIFDYQIEHTWEDLSPQEQKLAQQMSFGCYAGCHRPAKEGALQTLSPKLEGFDPQYFFEQIVDSDNRRKSGIMSQMKLKVYSQTIDQLANIALFYGTQEKSWTPDPEVLESASFQRGKEIFETSCAICHGEQGESTSPLYPSMKGQMPAYIFEQMTAYRDYKRNTRDAAKMVPFARMYDEEDYKDIVAYVTGNEFNPVKRGDFITGIGMPAPKGFKMPDTGQIQNFTDIPGEDSDFPLNPLSYTISDSGLVTKDNNTQLMWERDSSRIWMNPFEAQDHCEALDIDGYTDWRLPLMKELASIADMGDFRPAIDMDAFLNMPRMNSGIWTFPQSDHPDHYWHVGFPDAHIMGQHAASTKLVRCVRADGGAAFHNQEYVDNGDGTVSDKVTGLLWQQHLNFEQYNWDDALKYCNNLDYAGRTDWRLPNIKEGISIVNYNKFSPSIDLEFFPNTPADKFFWTSSTHIAGPTMFFRPLPERKKHQTQEDMDLRGKFDINKWFVGYQIGNGQGAHRDSEFWARCVTYDD